MILLLNARDYGFIGVVGKLFYCSSPYLLGERTSGFYPCFYAPKMATPFRGRRLQL
jgi:hypothetical protein